MIQMYVSKQGDVPAESRRIDGIFIKNVLTPLTEKGHTDTQTDRDTHTIKPHTPFFKFISLVNAFFWEMFSISWICCSGENNLGTAC